MLSTLVLLSAIASRAVNAFLSIDATLLFVFSWSHGSEKCILGRTKNADSSLVNICCDVAAVVVDCVEWQTVVDRPQAGDVILIPHSERIAEHGRVLSGQSTIRP